MRVALPEAPTVAEADDWHLLERSAGGDSDAFRQLVEKHQGRLIRLCERLLQDREEALDAAQEVFLKAYRKAGSLEPRGELFSWLYRVATNHCLKRLRRRRIVRFVPFFDPRSPSRLPHDPADLAADPEASLAARQRWQHTREQISSLPATQRAVLVLAKFEGLSYREIAATLGITEGAVESRLFRAMRTLNRTPPREDS